MTGGFSQKLPQSLRRLPFLSLRDISPAGDIFPLAGAEYFAPAGAKNDSLWEGACALRTHWWWVAPTAQCTIQGKGNGKLIHDSFPFPFPVVYVYVYIYIYVYVYIYLFWVF